MNEAHDDACLHAPEASDPGATAVNACVAAINTAACPIVLTPQNNVNCAWLVPGGSDAGGDVTAASDAAAASDGPDASDAPVEANPDE